MAVAATVIMDPEVVIIEPSGSPVEHDITAQVSSAELVQEGSVLDRTTFGNTWRNKGRGLKSGSLKLDFYVDFDPDGVFELFHRLWETYEVVGFQLTDPETGAVCSGDIVLSAIPSFSGSVDEYNSASLTYQTTGPITSTDGTLS